MFLQKYVLELDAQLARLIAARDVIAAIVGAHAQAKPIARPPKVVAASAVDAESIALEAVAVTAEVIVTLPATRRGRPRGSKNKNPSTRVRAAVASEPRALSSAIPTGPVVVSPAQLANRQVVVAHAPAPVVPAAALPAGGLDALIRELSERRLAAFNSAA